MAKEPTYADMLARDDEKMHNRLIGGQIRMRRLESGFSQKELAGQLGVSFQQVQKYEKGANRISAGRLFQIAALLEVPLEVFYQDIPAAVKFLREGVSDYDSVDLFTQEGLALLHAFAHVRDAEVRAQILALVKSLSAPAPMGMKLPPAS